jgi:hypothetical protein
MDSKLDNWLRCFESNILGSMVFRLRLTRYATTPLGAEQVQGLVLCQDPDAGYFGFLWVFFGATSTIKIRCDASYDVICNAITEINEQTGLDRSWLVTQPNLCTLHDYSSGHSHKEKLLDASHPLVAGNAFRFEGVVRDTLYSQFAHKIAPQLSFERCLRNRLQGLISIAYGHLLRPYTSQ